VAPATILMVESLPVFLVLMGYIQSLKDLEVVHIVLQGMPVQLQLIHRWRVRMAFSPSEGPSTIVLTALRERSQMRAEQAVPSVQEVISVPSLQQGLWHVQMATMHYRVKPSHAPPVLQVILALQSQVLQSHVLKGHTPLLPMTRA